MSRAGFPGPPFPARSASSYCTTGSGCALPLLDVERDSLNAFSVTSYYIALDGVLRPCGPAYDACNWTSPAPTVQQYNWLARGTGAFAQPLVFSNSGDMIAAFRALIDRGVERAAAFLAEQAFIYGYSRVQLDLEPSCWDENVSRCEWPTARDALNYVVLVNATAKALAAQGATLSLAVANWPGGAWPWQQRARSGSGTRPALEPSCAPCVRPGFEPTAA
jgi:hypothetical protein